MLVRVFEYQSQIALDDSGLESSVLTVKFPHSAVIYLRCSASTPDQLAIRIETPVGSMEYPVPVLKAQRYTLNEIFGKGLLFLIPFYIFSHEESFPRYEADAGERNTLLLQYGEIRSRLEELCSGKKISEYVKHTIMDMSNKVLQHIAQKYKNVREGVESVMGGKILEYEAKTIRNEGIAQGIERGELYQLIRMVRKKQGKGKTPEMIAEELEENLELVKQICEAVKACAQNDGCERVYILLREGEGYQ